MTRCRAPAASGAAGVKVAVRVDASYLVVPGTDAPAAVSTARPTLPAVTGLENRAETDVLAGTLDEPGSGVCASAIRGEASVAEKVTSTP